MGWSTKSPVKSSIFAADWPRHGDLIKRHDHQRKCGKHHQPLVMVWYGVCPKFWPNHSLNIRSLNDAFWNGHIRKAGNLLVRVISGFACTIMYYHDPPYLDLAQSIRSFRVRWSFSYLSLTECRWHPHLYCAPQSFPHSRGDGDKPRREQYPVISSAIHRDSLWSLLWHASCRLCATASILCFRWPMLTYLWRWLRERRRHPGPEIWSWNNRSIVDDDQRPICSIY